MKLRIITTLLSFQATSAAMPTINRSLQQLGQFCAISADVDCFLDKGKTKPCSLLTDDPIQMEQCGPLDMTFAFRYCNNMADQDTQIIEDVNFLKLANQSYRDVGIPLDLSELPRNTCRSYDQTITIDSCTRTSVPASIKFEGWVKGFQQVRGYYCYSYSYLNVRIPLLPTTFEPSNEPAFEPTTKPTINATFEPTNTPTSKPTNTPTSKLTNTPTAKPTNAPVPVPTAIPTLSPVSQPLSDPVVKLSTECFGEPDGHTGSGVLVVPCNLLTPDGSNECTRDLKFVHTIENESDEDVRIQGLVVGWQGAFDELVDPNERVYIKAHSSHVMEYFVRTDICDFQTPVEVQSMLFVVGVTSRLYVSITGGWILPIP